MIRFITVTLVLAALAIAGFLAFSHRILPAESDACQQDITHQGHIDELPLFHCIGHSEGTAAEGWDHVHPWMTESWHKDRELPFTGGAADNDDADDADNDGEN